MMIEYRLGHNNVIMSIFFGESDEICSRMVVGGRRN